MLLLLLDSFIAAANQLKIPVANLLLPLDDGVYYLANQTVNLRRNITPSGYLADMFGFPLNSAYFDGVSQSAIEALPSMPIQTDPDFTIAFHMRAQLGQQRTVLWFGSEGTLGKSVEILENGKLAVR